MPLLMPVLLASLLFCVGVYGVLARRNAILVLMAVELMLNAINLIFITADASVRAALVGVQIEAWAYPNGEPPGYSGGVFALFIIVLAAAEVGVGLAIVLQYYRLRRDVVLDDVSLGDES